MYVVVTLTVRKLVIQGTVVVVLSGMATAVDQTSGDTEAETWPRFSGAYGVCVGVGEQQQALLAYRWHACCYVDDCGHALTYSQGSPGPVTSTVVPPANAMPSSAQREQRVLPR